MLLMLTITLTITYLLTMVFYSLSPLKNMNQEKKSPFECGFQPLVDQRSSFSIHFFLIALIFLVFDVEIAFLMPIPLLTTMSPISSLTLTLLLMIIILGLIYEWKIGALTWA